MRAVVATLLVAGLTLSASAVDPRALAARLANPDYHNRESATRQLAALGPPAIPALEEVCRTGPPEAVRRATQVLSAIRSAEESRLAVAVKPVSLNFQKKPLSDAVVELRTLTGVNVTLSLFESDRDRPVTVLTGELPPWQAVEAFRAAAGLTEEDATDSQPEPPGSGPDRRYPVRTASTARPADVPVVWRKGTAAARPAADTTGVRIVVVGPASHDRVTREVAFHLDVVPTAGLNWQRTTEVRIGKVEADDGRRLEPVFRPEPPPPAFVDSSYQRLRIESLGERPSAATTRPGNGRTFPVALAADRAVTKLKVLEGVVCGSVHRANQPLLEIDDLTAAVGKTFDGPLGSTLTVESVKPSEVVVRCTALSPWVLRQTSGVREGEIGDVSFNSSVAARMTITDPAGKVLHRPTRMFTNSDGRGTREAYTFTFADLRAGEDAPKAVKLVVLGTRVVHVRVPFKLENVELK